MSSFDSDLTIGPSDLMGAVKRQYPWLNDYQAAQAVNLMLKEAAELVEQGGILGVLIPGNPPRFIAIEPIPTRGGQD